MGEEGGLGSGVRGFVGRSRLRVCHGGRHDHQGSPAWHWRKGGTQNQAIGRSRGGLTTKILALVDALGNLVRFVLLPGQHHYTKGVKDLIADVPFRMLLADKAFDVDWLRAELDRRGVVAVIPPKANRKRVIRCDFAAYKWRHLVEDFFFSLKAFRRIGTRYDKTDTSFVAMVHAASIVLALR